jgi:2,3-bisphosphoglycerate-independent phosphoglycerate mutase
MDRQRRILFLFLDGVGLGEDDPATNPFSQAAMPHLKELLGGHKLVLDGFNTQNDSLLLNTGRATLLAVDACLGIEGTPQSATGQAALLTGKNVPAWLGEHEGPKPTEPIIELIGQGTLFSRLHQNAREASLVNAFPPRYFESIERGYRLPGVIALSAMLAGMPIHTKQDLFAGKAVSADFSGAGWRSHLGYPGTPVLSINQVGQRLHALAGQADLAMFEYGLTDVAGHHQDLAAARILLDTLDGVIGSLVGSRDDGHPLILVTSDHGNLEDLRTRHHTRNDVPLLLIGSQSSRETFLEDLYRQRTCRSKLDLTDISPAILKFIG